MFAGGLTQPISHQRQRSELADDALEYCKANNLGQQFDCYRIWRLVDAFGTRPADMAVEDFRRWFADQEWKPATFNRYKSTVSLIYRLGIEHGKTTANPARLLKRKREDNGRVRFLNQYSPEEESKLRLAIEQDASSHIAEFEIALHTGMRPSEQYGLTWDRADFARRFVTIPKSKNGKVRHIPLNATALAAFQSLFSGSRGQGPVFLNTHGEALKGYKHWFEPAVRNAKIKDFTWYCLRHTFASRLVMAGVDLRTVAELMGHRTIQMTMRYARLAPAHNLAAVERLSSQPSVALPERATATRSATEDPEEGLSGPGVVQ
jgi:integrase